MSEYIKTGEELRDVLDDNHDSKEQWISLSWLTEQLKKEGLCSKVLLTFQN